MLDPIIIAEILRREREEREKKQQELPLQIPAPDYYQECEDETPQEDKRGVTVIDL